MHGVMSLQCLGNAAEKELYAHSGAVALGFLHVSLLCFVSYS